jgi:nucleoside 2-deoxyribosyltransferase
MAFVIPTALPRHKRNASFLCEAFFVVALRAISTKILSSIRSRFADSKQLPKTPLVQQTGCWLGNISTLALLSMHSNFMTDIKTYFTNLGFEITESTEYVPLVDAFVIKHTNPNVKTVFNWGLTTFDDALNSVRGKLKSILLKGIPFDKDITYDVQTLLNFIDSNFIKLAPEEKLNSVIEFLGNQASYDGQSIYLEFPDDNAAYTNYFNGVDEWSFYLDTAVKDEYINRIDPQHKGDTAAYNLTIKGLSKLLILNEAKESKICFIAMAFYPDMFEILRNSIQPALSQCGFSHYVVSDEHLQSEITINDAILAGIKKARFTIADFTHHRNGVYFEAGYALGRGQKVIYTCKQDEMEKSHFDVSHYQHIVWTDALDFKEKLINKIEAFIKD